MQKGKLNIIVGNIVDDNILELGDAIVNPTNPMMRMGWGVSMAIFQKAGADEFKVYITPQYHDKFKVKIKIINEFNLYDYNGVVDIEFIPHEYYKRHKKCRNI